MILGIKIPFLDVNGTEQRIKEASDYFVDARDGQKYRAVTIGGKIWMAQNLNYQPESGNFWRYGNNDANGRIYGILYDWDTAMSASPAGWHLPTRREWVDLVAAAGGDTAGRALKSIFGWSRFGDGADTYGFSALPGGYRRRDGGFGVYGSYGRWWTASDDSGGSAYYIAMDYGNDGVEVNSGGKSYGRSVRCVKDT